jgi:type VI secretion system protein ImpI
MSVPKYITLEVLGPLGSTVGANPVHTFDMRGGRVGRAPDNDWVINDPYVSRYQALIGYASGKFFLTLDPEASAPMFLNSTDIPLRLPQKYPLTSGDRILVSELSIDIALSDEQPRLAPRETVEEDRAPESDFDSFGNTFIPDGDSGAGAPGRRPDPLFTDPDIEDDVGPDQERRGRNRGRADGASDVLDEDVPMPAIHHPGHDLPDSWWQEFDTPDSLAQVEPPPEPKLKHRESGGGRPNGTGSPALAPGGDLLALLQGAGLAGAEVTPEVMASLGSILRIVVQGVVDLLRARNEIRREFHVPYTVAQAQGNNPLKLSANAEDALHDILVKHNPAYLPAREAFEEAFDDLRGHQLAMLNAMRSGYERMLTRFDPQRLENRFDPADKGAMFKGRARLWERYQEWFKEETEDPEQCFRRFFGDQFAKAYEQELGKLKQERPWRHDKDPAG